jgi:hypothetical protein
VAWWHGGNPDDHASQMNEQGVLFGRFRAHWAWWHGGNPDDHATQMNEQAIQACMPKLCIGRMKLSHIHHQGNRVSSYLTSKMVIFHY